ncbi:MAG TPA: S-methyl-5-thioribose-1-phosphate isomerase [Solirubrobacteraceae bacterium]
MVAPLRHEDGALLVLDQRALPGEERWLRCTQVEEVADAIETLAVRGAPAIGVAAAYGAALAADGDYDAAIERLWRTRPTAVNLHWALGRMREAGPARALETAHAIAEREDAATRVIAVNGAALFDAPARVMTHCNAGALATTGVGTALGVVRAAHDAGHVTEVWVPETRPLLQGARLTAWELAADGIPHHVITDSSSGLLMSRGLVDAAVVGADRIAANGDVANKIGTYPLAALAARHGVPFYVAAPSSTIDPAVATGADIPIEERSPDELAAPAGAPAANWAFDVTPHDLVTAIVTEDGVFRPPYAFA